MFFPQFVEKIWGGRKIQDFLGKELPDRAEYGESWEISEVEDKVSVVKNGSLKNKSLTELIGTYKEDLLGSKVISKYGDKFPLLIKFLDAQKDLSIQVHPNDALAKSKGQEYGKSEMWYILQAEKNATLFKGFKPGVDKNSFLESAKNSNTTDLLNSVDVNVDDVFYIPAGTVHNIGKGILLAEIQQSSDATYRIFDFERKGTDGQKRDLHLEPASEALNFNALDQAKKNFERKINQKTVLIESKHFITSRFTINGQYKIEYPEKDSFRIFICVHGKGTLSGNFESIDLKIGDTLLIPASINSLIFETDSVIEVLESQIP